MGRCSLVVGPPCSADRVPLYGVADWQPCSERTCVFVQLSYSSGMDRRDVLRLALSSDNERCVANRMAYVVGYARSVCLGRPCYCLQAWCTFGDLAV